MTLHLARLGSFRALSCIVHFSESVKPRTILTNLAIFTSITDPTYCAPHRPLAAFTYSGLIRSKRHLGTVQIYLFTTIVAFLELLEVFGIKMGRSTFSLYLSKIVVFYTRVINRRGPQAASFAKTTLTHATR